MYDIQLERAKLQSFRDSLGRLEKERKSGYDVQPLAYALLMCKEEDIRMQMTETLYHIRVYEAKQAKVLATPVDTGNRVGVCATCGGSKFVMSPRGNHSATPERVPCPDCPEGGQETQ